MLKICDADNFRKMLVGMCLIATPLVILIQDRGSTPCYGALGRGQRHSY
jgi:hypothetical protein